MRNFIYNVWMFFIPFYIWLLCITNWRPFHPLFMIVLILTILVIYDIIYYIKDKKDE
jgi:hypothetical protein